MLVIAVGVGYLSETAGAIVGVIGLLGLLVAGVTFSESLPRVGPQQPKQAASCCGCSCAIAVLLIPASALALWSAAGPEYAVLALPAWVPLVRLMDAAARLGSWLLSRADNDRDLARSDHT